MTQIIGYPAGNGLLSGTTQSQRPAPLGENRLPAPEATSLTAAQVAWVQSSGSGGVSLSPPASGSIATALQAAIVQLEAIGTGRLTIAAGSYTCDQNIFIKGGNPTLNGGYQGGIEIVGSSMWDTVITFSSGKGFIIDCGPAPTHGNNSAMAMIGIRDMKIVGPGKGVAGSVGVDCGPQGVYQTTPNAIRLERIWFDGWENHARFDDTTNLWVTYCYFLNYVKALRFGFNHDTMSVMCNRFGDNQTVIGSQTETAMAWDYLSPRFGSGGVVGTVGVAPNAAATLGGAQNHKIMLNWFMRQLLVADIADPSASNIVVEQNQFESCRHYAQLGNVNATQAPSRVEFKQNTFMRTDGQDETQAKFLFPNTGAGGSLHLIRNVGDSTNGPKAGWVQCGTGSIVEFDTNTLPIAGGYVTEANHLIVGASGKKIVLGTSEKYIFNTVTGGKDKRQFNASGNDNTPDREHWAYNATNATIFYRWGNKAAATDVLSGNTFDIIQRTINGTRYCVASGANLPIQGSASPSLGSDGAQFRGTFFVIQGGAGVADQLMVCLKSAADTYSWKLAVTG